MHAPARNALDFDSGFFKGGRYAVGTAGNGNSIVGNSNFHAVSIKATSRS